MTLAESTTHGPAGRPASFYHTFELPDGTVTDGYFDLRRLVDKLPLPRSLEGLRCLDVAACEGFWSIELARRGAAEVVSLDLGAQEAQDWQGVAPAHLRARGSGLATEHFHLIREQLGIENIERIDMNVYDANPEALGTFDYVFAGNILIHLADPARALRAVRSVMRPGSELLSLEATSLVLSLLSPKIPLAQLWDVDDQARWWTPNMAGHRRLMHAAGFELTGQGGPFFQPFGTLIPRWPDRMPRRPRELLFWLTVRRWGPCSCWTRARPASDP